MGLASTILAFAACAHAVSTTRRAVAGAVASIAAPPLASAGRVEEMVAERRYELDDAASLFGDGEKKSAVARAVTESKLGVDVRRRVVRGAQLADALDARWDQLSFLVNANKAAAPPPRPPPVAPPPEVKLPQLSDVAALTAANLLSIGSAVEQRFEKLKGALDT